MAGWKGAGIGEGRKTTAAPPSSSSSLSLEPEFPPLSPVPPSTAGSGGLVGRSSTTGSATISGITSISSTTGGSTRGWGKSTTTSSGPGAPSPEELDPPELSPAPLGETATPDPSVESPMINGPRCTVVVWLPARSRVLRCMYQVPTDNAGLVAATTVPSKS